MAKKKKVSYVPLIPNNWRDYTYPKKGTKIIQIGGIFYIEKGGKK
jgi:hypothetical protein